MGRLSRRIATALYARFPGLADRWLERHPIEASTDVPWTPCRTDPSLARLALVSTGGVHLCSQQPFDMDDADGDPGYRMLPTGAADAELAITHDYYDTGDARRDLNVVYPVGRLQELVEAGCLGALTANQVGMMGHVDGPHVATLVGTVAPELARRMRDERADIVLLAPA